jgi:hypothetical protein
MAVTENTRERCEIHANPKEKTGLKDLDVDEIIT